MASRKWPASRDAGQSRTAHVPGLGDADRGLLFMTVHERRPFVAVATPGEDISPSVRGDGDS